MKAYICDKCKKQGQVLTLALKVTTNPAVKKNGRVQFIRERVIGQLCRPCLEGIFPQFKKVAQSGVAKQKGWDDIYEQFGKG